MSVVTIFGTLVSIAIADDKLMAEEIVAKHLDSIGTKQKWAEIKNRLIVGRAQFLNLHPTAGGTSGKCVFVSEPDKLFFGSSFTSPNYPFEKVSFDGDKVNIAFVTTGSRSAFGNFILAHKEIFSSGLFTGSLSSSWSLLDLKSNKAKVKFAGKKKIDGHEVYILDYSPNRGTDLTIKLYFDAETYRHVRTEYSQTLSAAQGAKPEDSSRQLESRHQLTEDFFGFSEENGLTMPHSYTIRLVLSGQNATNEYEWKFGMSLFMFNQKLDPGSYDVN